MTLSSHLVCPPIRSLCAALIVASLALAPTCAPAQTSQDRPDVVVSATDRLAALEVLAARIEADYPDPELGERVAADLRRSAADGVYDGMDSAKAFVAGLTGDLRAWSGDEHFNVDYFVMPRPFPEPPAAAAGPSQAPRGSEDALRNFGVERVERLAGNIGYLKINRFADPEEAAPVLAAAMAVLGSTEALIIDLRDNRGGFAGSASFLATYLFDEQVQMSELRSRTDSKQIWTAAFVPGRRMPDQPAYVLTSRSTFSAAEGFAYDLQALGRVTVVGEQTRGGANPVARVLLSSRFGALVPTALSRNPITGSNWAQGVRPDTSVPAAEALAVAHRLALQALVAHHPDDALTAEIAQALEASQGQPAAQTGAP